MTQPVRIRSKRYASLYRIIRTTSHDGDLYWVCRDESSYVRSGHRGSIAWLSIDLWATGDWEVVYE